MNKSPIQEQISKPTSPRSKSSSQYERNSLLNPLKCPVCDLNYNDRDRRPMIAKTCGHTFCNICIRESAGIIKDSKLLKKDSFNKNKLECICRICKTVFSEEHVIFNYTLADCLEYYGKLNYIQSKNKEILESIINEKIELKLKCEEHNKPSAFFSVLENKARCKQCPVSFQEDYLYSLKEFFKKKKEYYNKHLQGLLEFKTANEFIFHNGKSIFDEISKRFINEKFENEIKDIVIDIIGEGEEEEDMLRDIVMLLRQFKFKLTNYKDIINSLKRQLNKSIETVEHNLKIIRELEEKEYKINEVNRFKVIFRKGKTVDDFSVMKQRDLVELTIFDEKFYDYLTMRIVEIIENIGVTDSFLQRLRKNLNSYLSKQSN